MHPIVSQSREEFGEDRGAWRLFFELWDEGAVEFDDGIETVLATPWAASTPPTLPVLIGVRRVQ